VIVREKNAIDKHVCDERTVDKLRRVRLNIIITMKMKAKIAVSSEIIIIKISIGIYQESIFEDFHIQRKKNEMVRLCYKLSKRREGDFSEK